jgi:hypothetical protein
MNLCFDDDGIQNVSSNERTTTLPSAKRERERERKNERHYSERIKERKVLLLL